MIFDLILALIALAMVWYVLQMLFWIVGGLISRFDLSCGCSRRARDCPRQRRLT